MTEQADSHPTREATSSGRRPRIRAGAVIAIALLAGLVVWLVVRGKSSHTSPRAGAVPVSVSGLKTLAAAVPTPIYWAGRKRGFTYELTKTSDNRVFIRYLPRGVPIGTNRPYLTIGTYPVPNAFAITSGLAKRRGAVKIHVGGGGVALYNKKSPSNVYVAYPGSSYQVEVYDPSALRARRLVSSGRITPVLPRRQSARPPRAAAKAVSPAGLKGLAASLHHPVYWAGREAGVTYEVERTTGGSVYVRYLPHGVRVGVDKPYLTVGTYRVKNAFSVTKALSRKGGAVLIKVGGGAVAFYNRARPTNVYVAYPGSDVQVEVYDPSPARAAGLVASKRVTPVG